MISSTKSVTDIGEREQTKDNTERIMGPKQTASQDPLAVCDQDLIPFISVSYRHDIYPPHEASTHVPNDSDVPKSAKKDLESTNKEVGVIKRNLAGRRLGDDFVKLDGFCMYRGRTVPGFPRLKIPSEKGLEAITFVKRGFVDYFDHKHGEARLGPGDALWIAPAGGNLSSTSNKDHPMYHTWSEFYPVLSPHEPNEVELVEFMFCCPEQTTKGEDFRNQSEASFDVLWKECQTEWHGGDQNASSVTLIAGSIKGMIRNIETKHEEDLNLNAPISNISRISTHGSEAFSLALILLDKESSIKVYKNDQDTCRTIILLEGLGLEVIDCETNTSETISPTPNQFSSVVARLSTTNTIEIKPLKEEAKQEGNNYQMVEMLLVEVPRLTSPDDKARFGSIIESMMKAKHEVEQAEPSLGAIEGDEWTYSRGPRECIHRHDETRFYRSIRHGTKQIPPSATA